MHKSMWSKFRAVVARLISIFCFLQFQQPWRSPWSLRTPNDIMLAAAVLRAQA